MSELSNTAIEIAITQIGQEEKPRGSNWGHPVIDYLNSVGIDFPAAWCFSFCYWCFDEAAKKLATFNPVVKTGGVLNAWNRATSHHVTIPQPGDIFIQDHGKGLGHAGIVEKVEGDLLHTIEGNTNIDGSREGFAVERKTRKLGTMKGFLRY